MPQPLRIRRYRRLVRGMLFGTMALAAVLRFIGLGFGHGVLIPRADEELLRSGVLISLTGDLNPHYAVWGHSFHYIYTVVAALWMAVQIGLGRAASWTDAVAAAHCEPWAMIWWGRAISASAGVLTLWATYQLARRSLGNRLVAVCSCLLLSTLFLHVRDSHFATSDVLLGSFSTAALAAMASRGRNRAGWAGFWTGLALATKLLAATVVFTFLTQMLLSRPGDRGVPGRSTKARQVLQYVLVAAALALLTQPFLLLDPMETWFGLFGDLFNPERRPFEHGMNLQNASIVLRYYVPQAMGWLVGGLAVAGGLHLLGQLRVRGAVTIVGYAFWSLVAILSVQRIFLRYLDPLLPVTCVLAAHALERIVHKLTRGRPAALRTVLTIALAMAAATPNLLRDIWLDHRLLQPDTRELAGRWIEANVPADSRILWSGYGSIAPHITMPWLHTPAEYDWQHIAARADRGLPTDVDEAIVQWKRDYDVLPYWLTGLSPGADQPEQSGLEAYPMLEHQYDLAALKLFDEWSRRAGLLRRESPRWDLMRRHVTSAVALSPESLATLHEDLIVITGMPCDPALVQLLSERYDPLQVFDPLCPGESWSEYGGEVMYDMGDAWYLPNWGINRVTRPGPQVRIYKRR